MTFDRPDEAPLCRDAARSRGVAAASPRGSSPSRPASSRRLRRKVMGFVVERIAEQRLLWHMRKAHGDLRAHSRRLTEAEADESFARC